MHPTKKNVAKMNKIQIYLIALLLSVLFSNGPLLSQSFTKITQGAFVTGTRASRGVNFIDYNGDGSLDLFVTNGKRYGQFNFLYRNDGGVFTNITNSQVTSDSLPHDGSSWADYDNDGRPDVCIVSWYDSNNVLYHNEGNGVFTRITNTPIFTDRGFSETCSWGDYDNDGFVDLLVTNSEGSNRKNFLYKNLGSGNFSRVDTGIVATDPGLRGRGVNWVDIDGDGKIDLFIPCEGGQNPVCYRNNGNGYFTKNTTTAIVSVAGEFWNASWADYDNDGDQDVFITNQANGNNLLYRNDGNFNFTQITDDILVNDPGYHATSAWGDFDNDGDLDLFVTEAYGPPSTPLKNKLYKNLLMETGTANFEKVTSGDIVNDLGFTYGCAWGDWNADGFLDLFGARTFNESQNNIAYLNNGNSNKWVEFKCTGMQSNKSAIGTKVRVKAIINGSPVWQLRVVEGQSGYCGQNLDLHFGLGNSTVIDSVQVVWPSGSINNFKGVALNQIYRIVENSGIIGIEQHGAILPDKMELKQNYPNPFNPSTKINFTLPKSDFITIKLYDSAGRFVKDIIAGQMKRGSYDFDFNAGGLASGVYFYTLYAENTSLTKKMILLK